MRQAKRSRIYVEAESNASLLAIAKALQYMRPPGQIYAEAESNASLLAIAEALQYMWPPGQIYAEVSNANLFAAVQASSIFECRRALVSPNGETSSNPFLYYKVPKGARLKGVYTPFRGCRLSLRGLKMSFEERRARVFKSLLLIP